MRVVERGHRARLALEALTGGACRIGAGMQHLDGDGARKARIGRAIDFAHSSGAKWGVDDERAELRTQGEEHPDCPFYTVFSVSSSRRYQGGQ